MKRECNTIIVTIDKGLATIRLNRPERLNSFSTQMHTELRAALDAIAANDNVRCVLITGEGRGFCAGQDLSERTQGDAEIDLGETLEKNYNPLIMQLTQLPIPIIAAVNGVAAGAGANFALACDLVFAAESASFIQSFNKLGLVPDAGGTWVLPRLIGQARAMRLCLLGEKVGAQQAYEMGMIAQVVADDALLPSCVALGEQLANAPTYGLGLTKLALRASLDNSLEQQLTLEKEYQYKAGRSRDFAEGVQAFLAKREARYIGK